MIGLVDSGDDLDERGFSRTIFPEQSMDFTRAQGDKIDLADVDARVSVPGNQTFDFIGQAQFSAEGQVRSYQKGGDTFIEVNTDNGAPGADMVIVLDTAMVMRTGDFLL